MASAPQAAGNSSALPETRPGTDLLHEELLHQNVEVMFGYGGGAIMPMFDRLYESPIRFVLSRHEQGAGHMADGYARATGKVGVCIATSGPGATNLTTALATAYMDSIPVVALTGQVATAVIGNDAFQEADVTGVTRPVTKHNFLIKDVYDLRRVIREAFHIAQTGRPGPVLVDLPKDVQVATKVPLPEVKMNLPGYRPRHKGHIRQIRLAAEAINASERPVLYVGGGVILSNAAEEVRQLMHRSNVPATTTLLAMGTVDSVDDEARYLGMLGMHGTAYANYAVQNCDVLVSIGARFDDRVTGVVDRFAPKAKVVHIDIDPSSISKNVKVDIPVVGDAKMILQELLPLIEHRDRAPWFERIAEWKQRYPLVYDRNSANIKPQAVIEEISRQTNGDAIITTGVGQHQMWSAQFYRFRHPRHYITSGGLSTMGFGLPSALGAQVGCPGKTVIDIDGDGSFQMTITEMATAVEQALPVKVVILNNQFQGMVRQWQEFFFDRRYCATRMHNPDFAALADAYGAKGMTIADKAELSDAIRELLASEVFTVANVHVEPEENVYPMVAVGKALDEMDMGAMPEWEPTESML
jgi:acetolactate synthase I/II/III large subunit